MRNSISQALPSQQQQQQQQQHQQHQQHQQQQLGQPTAQTSSITANNSRLLFRTNKQLAYWEHYYSNGYPFLNSSNKRKRSARRCTTFALMTCGVVMLVYFFVSSCLAYWSLQTYQHERHESNSKNNVLLPPSLPSATGAMRTTKRRRQQQQQQQNSGAASIKTSTVQPKNYVTSGKSNHNINIKDIKLPSKEAILAFLDQHGMDAWRPYISAYLEPPMKDIVPNTGDRGDMNKEKDHGTPPQLIQPLPLRMHSPNALQKITYTKVRNCHDMPANFPVDKGLQFDSDGNVVVNNVGDEMLPEDWKNDVKSCPVNGDPFLPWIHDVFPSIDGKKIHIIAQNKRRCHTGSKETEYVNYMTPQVALMQPVSVQRLTEQEARQQAPELWYKSEENNNNKGLRYKLVPREQVTNGHNYTRFICRFTTRNEVAELLVVGETLSEYEFNYEYAAYRKSETSLLTPKGQDSKSFWTSNIRFVCPVPALGRGDEGNDYLAKRIARGEMVLQSSPMDDGIVHHKYDGLPLLFLDIVPIRTSVRYKQHYLDESDIGPKQDWGVPGMDPIQAWGPHGHVLPDLEASGRWSNIPICLPPKLVTPDHPEGKLVPELPPRSPPPPPKPSKTNSDSTTIVPRTNKPHFLSACLWASAEFKTRGLKKGASTDTTQRLVEWLEFHLLVGFDHFYVYDNSRAHTNTTTLEPVLRPYMQAGLVTYYDWPALICNNNIPAADSAGERSTQYAAENSCRTRHSPFTEWIISFDTDEYLVPMIKTATKTKDEDEGTTFNLKHVLQKAHDDTGVNILTFRSSRGRLREDRSMLEDTGKSARRIKMPNTTFLEAYNCDSAGSPKPAWAERARKQVYLADYVLYHYVHYSTVTMGYLDTYASHQRDHSRYDFRFREHPPSERDLNELTEAVMVHTKTVKPDMTTHYLKTCLHNYTKKWQGCWIGFPWPNGEVNKNSTYRISDGMQYNCFTNYHLQDVWLPRLNAALHKRQLSNPELFFFESVMVEAVATQR